MKIIHRYLLGQLLRNLVLCLMVVVFLFLVFDFFDRIDNILAENASVWLTIQYFLFKVPNTVSLMLPVAMMASILFTVGIMSRNSEITAMRASGLTVSWIARPLFIVGFGASFLSLALNELVVPWSQRRAQEIYNIDIRRKDKSGAYSQSDFWWRDRDQFYSVGNFDSRDNTLHDLTALQVDDQFIVKKRVEAEKARWIPPFFGWNMQRVSEYRFGADGSVDMKTYRDLPLAERKSPAEFYDVKTNPTTMSYAEIRRFVRTQSRNGLPVAGYLAYQYEKLASPFLSFIVILVVLPFSLRPARSGSMAASVIAALATGFSYYAVHSFSIAMGRAELIPPLAAAWTANILMGTIGVILMSGAEAP